jgi:hypothetical protein
MSGALPLSSEAPPDPQLTLVWVGRGEAFAVNDGAPTRRPDLDYEYTVTQRRYADHWESTKEMHWRHPDHKGPRDQTLFFRIDLAPGPDGVAFSVESTLGDGSGKSDVDFREATVELPPKNASGYRLTQHYRYEDARLSETVEVLSGSGQTVTRIEEQAVLFAEHNFPAPPTRFGR